jgi:hypothetical protein
MGQLEIVTVIVFLVAFFTNYVVFSSSTFNVGFAPIFTILFLCSSIGAIYWIFFSSSGKDFAKTYNAGQKKLAEKRAKEVKEYYRNRAQAFAELENFSPSQPVFSVNDKSAISIDENSNNVCLLSNPRGQSLHFFDKRSIQRAVISYRDILEVSIFEDGNSITTTSRTSQVAGAIIGNIMLGGAGLLIGALTGSKKTSATVSSLEVRLIINNTQSPTWSIAFIGSETPKKSPLYQKAANEANNLLGLIKVLIKRADDEDKIAEIKKINPVPYGEQKVDVSEPAKNNDPENITSLLNQSLKKKGITAKARMQGKTLRIALASENPPNPDNLVPMIHKGIMGLNIDAVEDVEILGYRLGESSPSWSRILQM